MKSMKKIGLIGGLGPEATVDYYKEIIKAFSAGNNELNYPEIIVYSVNMSEFIGLMKQKEYKKATLYLLEKLEGLKRAGADFAAISANTPHLLFDGLEEKSPLPLISIVEATCREALKRNLKRPGLFGTGFTMNATFYADVFKKNGIEVSLPNDADKKTIDHKLFSEIELGIFKDDTRDLLIDIIQKMVDEQQIDSIILGCTEFPLILTETNYCGIPVLNTTQIHVNEIVAECLK
jgi:aspartate racemase